MSAKRIEAVLRPASIAVVGASETPGTLGEIAVRNLREGGFRGKVFYVNPRHGTVDGATSYASVRDLPQAVDMALVLSPAATVPDVLQQCGEKGVRGAVVVS